MTGSIKYKIRAGTLFLFFLVTVSGVVSIYYFTRLRLQSENVIKANYESIQYCHEMQKIADSVDVSEMSRRLFEDQLTKQENNVTESGEDSATKRLRSYFNDLRSGKNIIQSKANITDAIQDILYLNMNAIGKKNERVEKFAEEATTFLVGIVVFIFLIGLTFVYNFPSVVTGPVRKFTEAIREIGRKNYSYRIHVDTKDEFGQLATAFNEMAERLEYFENSNLNKLIFEKTRAEAVINSLKDASIGIDKNGTVLFVNEQALQLLGLKHDEAVGQSIETLSKRNDLFSFLVSGNENKSPFKIVSNGKENYYMQDTVDVTQGDSNSKVIVLKNITSFKELDAAKTDFIATISHELKTPLASSDISLKLLDDDRIEKEERKDLIRQLKGDNQRMLRILSELLNMSQVEAGKIQLDIQFVNPYEVVQLSVKAVEVAVKEKHMTLEKDIQKNLPMFKADGDKVTWVLNNFLTNAIIYSPEKTVVTIGVHQADNRITFSVRDNGPGIEEGYRTKIFERYYQVPGQSNKKGSGIGLAICKEFIEAMGGTIWVKSTSGSGSTFGFDLNM